MTERPANPEMVAGYLDGLDLSTPKPTDNRSFSYRHGFYVGRFEKEGKPTGPTAPQIRFMAERAERRDESR